MAMVSLHIVQSIADVEESLLSKYWSVLSDVERERCCRFRFRKDQIRYLVSRALIRYLASEFLGGDASAWQFFNNCYGKPFLQLTNKTDSFHFNLSHSDTMIVCAISHSSEIGVDVEKTLQSSDVIHAANDFFAPAEVQGLNCQTPENKMERFLQYWVLKEAFIKAVGMGLSIPLDKFGFDLRSNKKIRVTVYNNYRSLDTDWDFLLFEPQPDHMGALAIKQQKPNEKVEIFSVVPFVGGKQISLRVQDSVKF